MVAIVVQSVARPLMFGAAWWDFWQPSFDAAFKAEYPMTIEDTLQMASSFDWLAACDIEFNGLGVA